VHEINPDTGVVIDSLESVGGRQLGKVVFLSWDALDGNQFWLVDQTNHWVVLTDMDGIVYESWGEYGVPGPDDYHLKSPNSIVMKRVIGWAPDFILVNDRGNQRIVEINLTSSTVSSQLPLTAHSISHLYNEVTALSLEAFGTFFLLDLHATGIAGIDRPLNMWVPHPEVPWKGLAFFYNGVQEVDLDGPSLGTSAGPLSYPLFDGSIVQPGNPLYSASLPDWYRPAKALFIRASQKGKAIVETPVHEMEWLVGW